MPPELKTDSKFTKAFQNLKINAVNRLVSHFDMHSTLMELLNWTDSKPIYEGSIKKRSLSVFHEIPANRTCDDVNYFTILNLNIFVIKVYLLLFFKDINFFRPALNLIGVHA